MYPDKETTRTDVLRDILKLAQEELNKNGSIGYTMPDGRHHIYIYVDDSLGHSHDDTAAGDYFYVIEPNRVVEGAHEPMGDTTSAAYNNFAELLIGCMWCMDEFELDKDHQIETIHSNVKAWYEKAFPNDSIVADGCMNDFITFLDVVEGINADKDIYNILGVGIDSGIRENVFLKISEILNIDYDVIYQKWLHPSIPLNIPLTPAPKTHSLDALINSADSRATQKPSVPFSKEKNQNPEH